MRLTEAVDMKEPADEAHGACARHPDQASRAACSACDARVCFLCRREEGGRVLCLGCHLTARAGGGARRVALGLPAAVAGLVALGWSGVVWAERSRDAWALAALPVPARLEAPPPLVPSRDPEAAPSETPVPQSGSDPEPRPRDGEPGSPPEPAAPATEPSAPGSGPRTFTFQREDVLGTSFRLTVVAPSEEVAAGHERTALEAIEAQRRVFSGYDPESELSKLNAMPWSTRVDLSVSPSLGSVLRRALAWHERTHGAFDGYLGELHDLWREADRRDEAPAAEALRALAEAAARGPGYSVSRQRERGKPAEYRLTCDRAGRFDLDGIAKGYIVDRAIKALQAARPPVQGALVELGGDLRVMGSSASGRRTPWIVDVADPRRSAENAPPLERITLTDLAVASSGGYERGLMVAGRRRPHILDPRAGQPVDGILGATVVSGDATTSDALATALCVLDPAEGIALLEREMAAGVVVDRTGAVHRSSAWSRVVAREQRAAAPWPAGYTLEVTFCLVDSTGVDEAREGGKRRAFKRHGTAVWIEDTWGRRVRLLALWFKSDELDHVHELDSFWREGWILAGGGSDPEALRTWTRASRAPGRYTLERDGADDSGRPVSQGRYRVRVDVNREDGPPRGREEHTVATVELDCGAEPTAGSAADQPELAEVGVRYGPGGTR